MTVYTKTYSAPAISEKEILRYAGVTSSTEEIAELMAECLDISLGSLSYNVCFAHFPIKHISGGIDFGFSVSSSECLKKNLSDCDSVVLFAATVGSGLDRLIARYSVMSPAKAFMLQAIGAERIEALCNLFNQEISEQAKADGRATAPRFSAGYGDLPLEFQRDIFKVLDCQRKIGVTLQESLIMLPSKSVTAIIGIKTGDKR